MPIADHLNSLATDRGILAVLAIDHRDALRVALKPDDPGSVPASPSSSSNETLCAVRRGRLRVSCWSPSTAFRASLGT